MNMSFTTTLKLSEML